MAFRIDIKDYIPELLCPHIDKKCEDTIHEANLELMGKSSIGDIEIQNIANQVFTKSKVMIICDGKSLNDALKDFLKRIKGYRSTNSGGGTAVMG
ncbi:MAG: hypothetical protein CME70_03380 [Halobacteriovorax sp.]|nr:hypothetical protein [Halobacteriovorax sp.]MBK23026.1 hypothetical protein [Halobacteriovorax sp.]|tara:strand:- start:51775 stop:52059 length:285 start_codon:yes stop_codon:yes gene_type:complete